MTTRTTTRRLSLTALFAALLLGSTPAAVAHESFSCGMAVNITVGAADAAIEADTPLGAFGTVAEVDDVPLDLVSFRIRGYVADGLVQEETTRVAVWTDFVPGTDAFHVYAENGAPLVRVIIDECGFT